MDAIQLHICDSRCPPSCSLANKAQQAVNQRSRAVQVIDLHCHVFVPDVERLTAQEAQRRQENARMRLTTGEASSQYNDERMLPDIAGKLVDPGARLEDMERLGIDLQVLSPSPSHYCYWADEALATALVDVQNNAILALIDQHPEKFSGFCALSLQHPELAVAQLETAVKNGFRGAEISTHVEGTPLSSPALEPLWACAEKLGAVIFIHPFGADLGDRLDTHYLSNVIGQPLETTIALSQLIFGGVFDRYPNLKILAAHSGGYLPFYPERSNHGHRVRPEAQTMKHAPSEYLRRIWFDTLVYTPEAVQALINSVGVDQVVVGTDYPFDMGAYDIHALVNELTELSPEEREKILSNNAKRLLGL